MATPALVTLPNTPSLQFNNLSLSDKYLVYSHKTEAVLVPVRAVRNVRDGASEEMLHVPSAELKMIMQSRFCSFDGAALLVLATAGGVQIWDKDGKYMVFVFAFDDTHVTMPQGASASPRCLAVPHRVGNE